MRMWMVDPRILCRQHLLGEHVELHMLVGTIKKKRWRVLDGLADAKCIETSKVKERHTALVKEMKRRGMNHASPLQPFQCKCIGSIDELESLALLLKRCPECRKRHNTTTQSGERL